MASRWRAASSSRPSFQREPLPGWPPTTASAGRGQLPDWPAVAIWTRAHKHPFALKPGPKIAPQQRGPRNNEDPRGQRTGGKFAPKPSGKAVDGDGGHAPMRRKGAAPAGKKPGGKAAHTDGAAGRIASKPFRKTAKTKAAASKPAGKAGRRPNKQRAAS